MKKYSIGFLMAALSFCASALEARAELFGTMIDVGAGVHTTANTEEWPSALLVFEVDSVYMAVKAELAISPDPSADRVPDFQIRFTGLGERFSLTDFEIGMNALPMAAFRNLSLGEELGLNISLARVALPLTANYDNGMVFFIQTAVEALGYKMVNYADEFEGGSGTFHGARLASVDAAMHLVFGFQQPTIVTLTGGVAGDIAVGASDGFGFQGDGKVYGRADLRTNALFGDGNFLRLFVELAYAGVFDSGNGIGRGAPRIIAGAAVSFY